MVTRSEKILKFDAVIVGAGVMGATMAATLADRRPEWSILLLERLGEPSLESTSAWHNAGTGHAALCELNYTPMDENGNVSIEKAVRVHAQWLESVAAWDRWRAEGKLSDDFRVPTPHMSFVKGAEDVAFLEARYNALKAHPHFSSLEFTTDPEVIKEWAPLLIEGREGEEPVAATRSLAGRDVDFGRLTRELLNSSHADIRYNAEVRKLKRLTNGWRLTANVAGEKIVAEAGFVFVAAGGGTLPLLQKAKLKEARGFGGFPIAGKFWHSETVKLVDAHRVKVYGQAAVGAPPMSVPHLDARQIDGEGSVLFGPFAGFSTKFLRNGSLFDLFKSLRWHNLAPMLSVGLTNFALVKYLITELVASKAKKLAAVREFYPQAHLEDWSEIVAGQRVQVIKPVGRFRGELQFGTELIVSEDGTMAGLLGASPGASTAVTVVREAIERAGL